jgi:hypothetical protein
VTDGHASVTPFSVQTAAVDLGRMNLRIPAATAAALALFITPAAHAKNVVVGDVFVCNTASQNWQGDQGTLVVSPADPQGALRYDDDLLPKTTNAGLVNAAAHSRALALCGDPAPAPGDGGNGWGGTGG